jgi:cytochrome c5
VLTRTKTIIASLALWSAIPGLLQVAPPAAAADARSGDQVYQQVCAACHATGVADAPKYGDGAAWETRIAEGQEILTAHGWVGMRGMPPRGGRPDLPLQEFAAAVAYMARSAGADWQPPNPGMLARVREEIEARKTEVARKQ